MRRLPIRGGWKPLQFVTCVIIWSGKVILLGKREGIVKTDLCGVHGLSLGLTIPPRASSTVWQHGGVKPRDHDLFAIRTGTEYLALARTLI